jgi:putative protein-disulfide isomerase
MQKLKIVYVYDAHCSWCYAFSGEMKKFYEKYKSELDFEVISGGMVINEQVGQIRNISPQALLNIYGRITEMTGTKFGDDYLEKVGKGDLYANSEIPAVALSVFKSHQPENAIHYAHALQNQLFVQNKKVNDSSLYHELAEQFELDGGTFVENMREDKYQQAARYDFALSRQLEVTGYPQVLVQTDETHFYLVARGYTPADVLESRVQTIMEKTAN